MESRGREIRVGLTSLLAVLILAFGSIWGKDIRLGASRGETVFVFPHSGGLAAGDPVRVNGVKKGRVTEVFLSDGKVHVRIALNRDVVLHDDVRAGIGMVDLMGGTKIDIDPGDSGRQLNWSEPGTTIAGSSVFGIEDLMQQGASLAVKTDTLLGDIGLAVRELRGILSEEEFQEPVRASLQNLQRLSGNLDALLQRTTPKIEATLGDAAAASSRLRALLNDNAAGISESLESLQAASSALHGFAGTLDSLQTALNERRGTVGKLVYEDTLYTDLRRSIAGVDSLTSELRLKLGRYLNGADLNLLKVF